MACIRVERIVDYLCEPLHRTLKDESPYVRKTAVICIAKLFAISPDLVDENGFLESLQLMLADNNTMVLSNVIATLADIHAAAPKLGVLRIDSRIASRLVSTLGDCSEWGQVALLDALVDYVPEEVEQVEFFIETILPRLQHANPSIVLSAFKVLLQYISYLPLNHEMIETVKRKLAPPFVSIISSSSHEIQYVALRNMKLVLQKYPEILAHGIRIFFCKYNDPLYIKIEKLQLILMLSNEDNVEQIYPELADYAKEVDVEFVRMAIKCIGEVAEKLPNSILQAADIFIELSKTDIRYVVQEILIASKNLLLHFPSAFSRVLPELCKDLSYYDDPDSRSALLWIIGEYPNAVPDSLTILAEILEGFKLEPAQVQSQLFSTILKLFIRAPDEMRPLITNMIEKGKSSFDSAELRDRALFYERLVKLDPQILRSLKLESVSSSSLSLAHIDPALLGHLLKEIGNLASVYHQLPQTFLTYENDTENLDHSESASILHGNPIQYSPPVDLLCGESESAPSHAARAMNNGVKSHMNLIDLL